MGYEHVLPGQLMYVFHLELCGARESEMGIFDYLFQSNPETSQPSQKALLRKTSIFFIILST